MEDKILKLLTLSGGQELHIFMRFTPNCSKIHDPDNSMCSTMKLMLEFLNHVVNKTNLQKVLCIQVQWFRRYLALTWGHMFIHDDERCWCRPSFPDL